MKTYKFVQSKFFQGWSGFVEKNFDDVITKDIKELGKIYRYAEFIESEVTDADFIKLSEKLSREFNVDKDDIEKIVRLCVMVDEECIYENIYFVVNNRK